MQSPMALADANGFDNGNVDAINGDWTNYVMGDNQVPCSTVGADFVNITVSGNNAKDAFNFFVKQGLSGPQAAGIVGNLMQESGVNPGSNNTAATHNAPDPSSVIAGVTWWGGGIAQWEGGRWSGPGGLLSYVAGKSDFNGQPHGDPSNSKSWENLGIQLNYMWAELNGTPAAIKQAGLAEVRRTSTPGEAAQAFELAYERAGIPRMDNRIKYANQIFALYGAQTGGSVVTAADTVASDTGCALSAGIANTEGYSFPLAPQTQRDYTTLPCKQQYDWQKNGVGKDYKTVNNVYTNKYGISLASVTCHHDATPAFDLMYGDGGAAGKPVYAITDGTIVNVDTHYANDASQPGKYCEALQFLSTKDKSYYWYGHILNVSVSPGQTNIKAGQQIAVVATKDYGPKCWGSGPHLHIDRGCVDGAGKHQHGGNTGCRDPSFLADLPKIWSTLPK